MGLTFTVDADTRLAEEKLADVSRKLKSTEKDVEQKTGEMGKKIASTVSQIASLTSGALSLFRSLGISFGAFWDQIITAVLSTIGFIMSTSASMMAPGPISPTFWAGVILQTVSLAISIGTAVKAEQERAESERRQSAIETRTEAMLTGAVFRT